MCTVWYAWWRFLQLCVKRNAFTCLYNIDSNSNNIWIPQVWHCVYFYIDNDREANHFVTSKYCETTFPKNALLVGRYYIYTPMMHVLSDNITYTHRWCTSCRTILHIHTDDVRLVGRYYIYTPMMHVLSDNITYTHRWCTSCRTILHIHTDDARLVGQYYIYTPMMYVLSDNITYTHRWLHVLSDNITYTQRWCTSWRTILHRHTDDIRLVEQYYIYTPMMHVLSDDITYTHRWCTSCRTILHIHTDDCTSCRTILHIHNDDVRLDGRYYIDTPMIYVLSNNITYTHRWCASCRIILHIHTDDVTNLQNTGEGLGRIWNKKI